MCKPFAELRRFVITVLASFAFFTLMSLHLAAAPVVIEFWHPYGPPWNEIFETAAADFNKAHTDIQVKMVFRPGSMPEKLRVAVAGGAGPDLAHVFGVASVLELADANVLLPLDEPLRTVREWNPKDLFPPFLEAFQYRGRVWALPAAAQPTSLVWNKDVFATAGLDTEAGPRTQIDFEQAIKKITRFDSAGKLERIGFLPGMWGGNLNWAYHWGDSFYDPQARKITADSPVNVEAAEWIINLYNQYGGLASLNAFRQAAGSDPLYLRKLGMQLYSHYHYYLAHQNAPEGFEYGFAPPPVLGPPGAQPKGPVVHTDGNVLVAGSKHPREAALALHWMTVGMGGLSWIKRSAHPQASISINRYAMERNLVPDWYPKQLWLQNFDVLYTARPWPNIPVQAALTREVEAAYSRAFNGQESPRVALAKVNQIV